MVFRQEEAGEVFGPVFPWARLPAWAPRWLVTGLAKAVWVLAKELAFYTGRNSCPMPMLEGKAASRITTSACAG